MDITKPPYRHTLAEAAKRFYFGASCNDERCRSGVRRLDPTELIECLGPDILVRDIRLRLRCSKCGSKNIIVTTLYKDASTSQRMIEHWTREGPSIRKR